MADKTQVKKPDKKSAKGLIKAAEDKKAIQAQIRAGGNLSELSSKGIRFVKPL